MPVLRKPHQWRKYVGRSVRYASSDRAMRLGWNIRKKKMWENAVEKFRSQLHQRTHTTQWTPVAIEKEVDRVGANKAKERVDTSRVEIQITAKIMADTLAKTVIGKENMSAKTYPKVVRLIRHLIMVRLDLTPLLNKMEGSYPAETLKTIPLDDRKALERKFKELNATQNQISSLTSETAVKEITGGINELFRIVHGNGH